MKMVYRKKHFDTDAKAKDAAKRLYYCEEHKDLRKRRVIKPFESVPSYCAQCDIKMAPIRYKTTKQLRSESKKAVYCGNCTAKLFPKKLEGEEAVAQEQI
jgi:hypothetical protein